VAFDQFKSPRVPSAPKEYDFPYFNQLARALDNFFTNFDSRAGINVDSMSINRFVTPFTALTVANGTNNNLVIPATTFFRISAPTSTFSITGILTANAIYNATPTLVYSALDGQQVVLYNSTTYAMTIANQSASSDAPNRIITNTGADIVTTGSGAVTLIYSKADARWVVISAQL
jgi:hypothetical protein